MRKSLFWIPILLVLALASLTVQVQADSTPGVSYSWIGFTFQGTDSYYNPTRTIVAYKEGTKAILTVNIYNNYTTTPGKFINVSAVNVSFDWSAVPYSAPGLSASTPLEIPSLETRTVAFNFTIPSVSVATNLYLHSYTIRVEHTSDKPPATYTTETVPLFRSDFAVYSTVQADAIELSKVINSIKKPTFISTRANLLWLKSDNVTATAWRYYDRGDFPTAKENFQTALNYRSLAYSAEETYGVAREELDIKVSESLINLNNSAGTLMVLFGSALVLFAIGYIIKGFAALRKPTAPP